MASVLSLATPALACGVAARRPAARSAAASCGVAPRAALAVRQSRPAALATQRVALAGVSATQCLNSTNSRRATRRAVGTRAALDSVISPLKAGPPAATYQATAIAAAVLAVKLAYEANGVASGGLLLAAGYAVHAGGAYAIAAAGGKPGSETLKRINAGLVRHAADIM